MTNVKVNQRWAPLCSDCWYLACPHDYFPDHTGYDECASCGQEALIVNVHPEVAREAKAERIARGYEE